VEGAEPGVEVAAVSELCNQTETLEGRIEEGFFVLHNVGVIETGEDADLVEEILDLSVIGFQRFHLLEGVDL
jgi:hypothetical protein